jgi:hypothetical protein
MFSNYDLLAASINFDISVKLFIIQRAIYRVIYISMKSCVWVSETRALSYRKADVFFEKNVSSLHHLLTPHWSS